jgi:hypothetical protein
MQLDEIQSKVAELLDTELGDKFPHSVQIYNGFGGASLQIWFCCSNNILDAVGSKPQLVSLSLDKNLHLQPQIYGGAGGRTIDRDIDPIANPKEKYYCMGHEVIPFRKPKPEMDKVLKCLKTFITNYKKLLKDNIHRLKHRDICDYEKLLN